MSSYQTAEKQNFLRVEIIEQNYNPDEFTEWMEKQKVDGKKILTIIITK